MKFLLYECLYDNLLQLARGHSGLVDLIGIDIHSRSSLTSVTVFQPVRCTNNASQRTHTSQLTQEESQNKGNEAQEGL